MLKNELRKKYKSLRREFSPLQLDEIAGKVIENLLASFSLDEKEVSTFVPLTRFNEINTWLIVDRVNARFSLPVIGEEDKLVHIRYEGKHQLKLNSFGILEPVFGNRTDEKMFDIVIVPLLTIDQNGYRVGYGKGYYDQFLAQCRPDCLFIGLYQFDTIEVIDDLFASDVPLDYCVTPSRVIRF